MTVISKIKAILAGFPLLLCAASVSADTFTAADFVEGDKFCTQLFWTSNMLTDTPRPQHGTWSRFEYVYDKQGEIVQNEVKLKSFYDGGEVNFLIEGDELVLYGLDKKSGVDYYTSDGKKHRLVTVKKVDWKSPWPDGKTYMFMKYNPAAYYGKISRLDDGSVSVTFNLNDVCLQVNRRLTVAENPQWEDDINSFSRVDFRIFDSNGYMDGANAGEKIPVHITYEQVDNSHQNVYIRNFAGCGVAFHNESVGDFSFYDKGITAVKNVSNNTFSMPRQGYTGSLKVDYSKWGAGLGVGAATGQYVYRIANITVDNVCIEGGSQAEDIAGTIEEVRNVQPGWHKNCGGSFTIESASRGTSQWKTFSQDEYGNRTEINSLSEFTIASVNDITPNASFGELKSTFSDWGIFLKGFINEDVTPHLVESYDIFVAPEYCDNVASGSFDGAHEYGHNKAVLATFDGPVVLTNDSLKFEITIPMDNIKEKGWTPYYVDGKYSVYLRFNLKDVPMHQASRKAAPLALNSVLAFGGLKPVSGKSIPTSVESVNADKVYISVNSGCITVYGSQSGVKVYSIDGKLFYEGHDNIISLPNGLYIVKAGDKTVKCKL